MLTLKALQRRELTLEQIKGVLENITVGVTLGVVDREMNVEKVLADALAGMDDALLKVVEASKVALERLGGAGQDYEDSYLKQALRDLERFEDAFLQSVAKAADSAGRTNRHAVGAGAAQDEAVRNGHGRQGGLRRPGLRKPGPNGVAQATRDRVQSGAPDDPELCDARQWHSDRNVGGVGGERRGVEAQAEPVQAAQERGQARDDPGCLRKAQDDPPGQDVSPEDRETRQHGEARQRQATRAPRNPAVG